jgi:hypothetical protein
MIAGVRWSTTRVARLGIRFSVGCALIIRESWDSLACLAIDSVGWPLIIRLIIQTILLYPSGAVWTDEASNVSSLDPSGAIQIDAEHPSRNRKVEGSNPSSGSKTAGHRAISGVADRAAGAGGHSFGSDHRAAGAPAPLRYVGVPPASRLGRARTLRSGMPLECGRPTQPGGGRHTHVAKRGGHTFGANETCGH